MSGLSKKVPHKHVCDAFSTSSNLPHYLDIAGHLEGYEFATNDPGTHDEVHGQVVELSSSD
jgi:hypothetical protein